MARILVVEDDIDFASKIRSWLRMELYNVELAHDGETASVMLDVSRFDVLILDWGLPGQSGIEVLRRYRTQGGDTPVLMLTARSHLNDKQEGFDFGCDDYLTKPFELKELSLRLKAILRRSREA